MALEKKFLKSKPVCKVTFKIEAPEAQEIMVVGDFNNWDSSALPLKKQKNGIFKGTADLDIEKSFEFKYVVDGEYTNEAEADGYVFNEFAGAENSVINTTP